MKRRFDIWRGGFNRPSHSVGYIFYQNMVIYLVKTFISGLIKMILFYEVRDNRPNDLGTQSVIGPLKNALCSFLVSFFIRTQKNRVEKGK